MSEQSTDWTLVSPYPTRPLEHPERGAMLDTLDRIGLKDDVLIMWEKPNIYYEHEYKPKPAR